MRKFTSFPNPANIPSSTIKSLYSFFSSLPKNQDPDSVFVSNLIESFKFSKSRAIALSNKYSSVQSLEKTQNVWRFFRNMGFSDAHIQSTIRGRPQLLRCNVDKTLKPKIEFFQNLGVTGSDLCKLISKNPCLLTVSIQKRLIPIIEIFKQLLVGDENNEYLIRVLSRCNSVIARDPDLVLLRKIELFKSCGIVGSQLSLLLSSKPRLFVMSEFKLKKLVSQLSEMGILVNSRMFAYGLATLACMSEETFLRKLELFRSFGFSKDELMRMFRKAPTMLRLSEERLKSGLEFFLRKAELEKEALFNLPGCLMFSMENRVIPRYRVLKILTSRRLLKKECSFPQVLFLSNEKFLQKFVLQFGDDAEELSLAYKGQKLGTLSSSSSSSKEES